MKYLVLKIAAVMTFTLPILAQSSGIKIVLPLIEVEKNISVAQGEHQWLSGDATDLECNGYAVNYDGDAISDSSQCTIPFVTLTELLDEGSLLKHVGAGQEAFCTSAQNENIQTLWDLWEMEATAICYEFCYGQAWSDYRAKLQAFDGDTKEFYEFIAIHEPMEWRMDEDGARMMSGSQWAEISSVGQCGIDDVTDGFFESTETLPNVEDIDPADYYYGNVPSTLDDLR